MWETVTADISGDKTGRRRLSGDCVADGGDAWMCTRLETREGTCIEMPTLKFYLLVVYTPISRKMTSGSVRWHFCTRLHEQKANI
jgi:hypothetical protein